VQWSPDVYMDPKRLTVITGGGGTQSRSIWWAKLKIWKEREALGAVQKINGARRRTNRRNVFSCYENMRTVRRWNRHCNKVIIVLQMLVIDTIVFWMMVVALKINC
jgi:hypothetical protein